jgi:WD40 repeat protein
MVVSNPLAARSLAYVSAMPGTFPSALSAVVRNETRVGALRSVQIIDGGFDPIGFDAKVGDRLSLTVSIEGGGVRPSIAIEVPARRPPSVVRTNPPEGRTAIASNAKVVVVFSEPVDESSVTSSSVALVHDRIPINASVRVSGDRLSAEFIPDSPLQFETTYSLVINQEIRDLEGDALADAFTVVFTTEPPIPAGQLVFAQLTDRQIYRINLDGTGLTRLTSSEENSRPVWSPDGRRIAFARRFKGPENRGWGLSDIYVMDADGSNVVRRTVGSNFWSAAWSPDGRKLAVSDEDIYIASIYLISAEDDGAAPSLLATYARSPAWSPDGKQIAYVHNSGDDGYHQVYVMDADGTAARPLTELDPGGIYGLAWSPNGQRIAFSKCLTGACDLYVMGAGGGGASQITNVGNAQEAAWSPDGKWIALTLSTHSGSEWVPSVAYVSAGGGTPRVVATGGFNPSWRP